MWKKYIKNINAILFLVSILCVYKKLLTGVGDEISAYMIMKIGMGFVDEEGISYWLYYYLEQYFNGMAGAILGLMIFCLITTIELLLIKNKKTAHVSAIISSAMCIVFVGNFYCKINEIINTMDDIYSYFGGNIPTEINKGTALLWIGCYVLIFILAILGLCYKEDEKEAINQVLTKGIKISNPIVDNKSIYENKKTSVQNDKILDFHGAVVGNKGIYQGMAYLLQEKRKIFVKDHNGLMEFSAFEEHDAVMEFYYISEYQEYCVEVNEKKMVFLMSGQPLGTNKKYYLPRGTEFYIKDDTNIFELS